MKKHIDVTLLFQFQTGSIKSEVDARFSKPPRCFNSKLVRLKVKTQIGEKVAYMRFNSKLVRLKAYKHATTLCMFACFNSKLVRLKG